MNIYFVGIAGAGMSALASVLASQGHHVEGVDQGVFPPVSTYLDGMRVPWRDGFDAALMPSEIDLAIVGSSARLDIAANPEVAELTRRGIARFSFPEFLGRHTAARDNLVVAGSFGKSTLAALLAVLLREARKDPGYFIGAVPLDLPATGHWGADRTFIVEGDEYIVGDSDRRPKFMLYHPQSLIISSIVHDHVNVYPTMATYESAFADLLALLPAGGLLVCAAPFASLRRLTRGRSVVWYGREKCEGYHADAIAIGEVTVFDLVTPSKERIRLSTELLGLHNIENIVGASALLLERGDIDAHALASGVRKFRGVERRLDKKTRTSRVPVFEGFGSSYEKARSAIEAIVLHFPDRPLLVIFEPHAFSWRSVEALSWYDSVFEGVDDVVLLPPPDHGPEPGTRLSQAQIEARIAATGATVRSVETADEALALIQASLTGREVVLLLSSGPLGGLAQSAPALLDRQFG